MTAGRRNGSVESPSWNCSRKEMVRRSRRPGVRRLSETSTTRRRTGAGGPDPGRSRSPGPGGRRRRRRERRGRDQVGGRRRGREQRPVSSRSPASEASPAPARRRLLAGSPGHSSRSTREALAGARHRGIAPRRSPVRVPADLSGLGGEGEGSNVRPGSPPRASNRAVFFERVGDGVVERHRSSFRWLRPVRRRPRRRSRPLALLQSPGRRSRSPHGASAAPSSRAARPCHRVSRRPRPIPTHSKNAVVLRGIESRRTVEASGSVVRVALEKRHSRQAEQRDGLAPCVS